MEGGLQRSVISFRRQGSSGSVWNDKLLSEHQNNRVNPNEKAAELRPSRSEGESSVGKLLPHGDTNIVGGPVYKTVKVSSSPNFDPPSPKVSACGFCGVFGKPASPAHKRRSRKR